DLSKVIGSSQIKSVGLNSVTINGEKKVDLLKSYTTSTGQSALIPATGQGDYTQIQQFLKQLTSDSPIVKESANVVVLNSGNTNGLATAEAGELGKQGMYVSATADASPAQNNNTIIDNSKGKDPATLKAIEKLFGTTIVTSKALSAKYPDAAFIVILGQ